jgi:hypothetical protein
MLPTLTPFMYGSRTGSWWCVGNVTHFDFLGACDALINRLACAATLYNSNALGR